MKKGILLICILLMLVGCTKDDNKEKILKENQYYLVAADGERLLVNIPKNFYCDEKEKKVSMLKAFYRKSSTKPLQIYFFKESDDYSVKDIETEMEEYRGEYEELVSLNQGKIESLTESTDITIGSWKGKYVEVTYSLDDNVSYCGEFYLKKENYVMHGTVRLDGDDTAQADLKTIMEELMKE